MARLFVALEVPAAVQRQLSTVQEQLGELLHGAKVRWQRPESSHLTLVFLGELPEAGIGPAGEMITAVARRHPPPTLSTSGLGAFPSSSRPSVLWLGIAGELEPLARLQADLATVLGGLVPLDRAQAFRPHLTLARIRSLPASRRGQLRRALETIRPEPAQWQVRAVHLFESELSPGGARYRIRRTGALGTPV